MSNPSIPKPGRVCMSLMIMMLLLMVAGTHANAQGLENSSGHLSFLVGVKYLDEGDWEPLDQQTQFGMDVDFRMVNWPVNLVAGVSASFDDDTVQGVDVEGSTGEFYFGVRKIIENHPVVRPYFGLGLALIAADLEASQSGVKVSDDDSALGYWLGGGLYFTVARNLNVGFDIRYSQAEVELFGVDGEAGGTNVSLLIGYHW